MKIKSKEEKTTQEKPLIGPNVASPGGSTGRLIWTGLQSELNGLLM
jgi:hypothetical protein